ncbi:hypothetical protein PSI23_02345 [Xenorhabdus sp. XENO-10]|uniref:Uncharacterized protein n=1 Tax=Xenorhabdus yunnanensis TaxID=3025878 RepID=A0ABT5LCC1_9GAMM|nr:hypothetical protein [Xenorhabdus yunnanensis]MDC9588183.1 hypothetical protein [Xenorhabdus yunnanensis]
MNSNVITHEQNSDYLVAKSKQAAMFQSNIPQGVSMAERLLWEINAEDHQ